MKVVADSHNYSSADTLASSLREHAEGTEVAIRLEGDGESSGFEIIWIEVIRRPMMYVVGFVSGIYERLSGIQIHDNLAVMRLTASRRLCRRNAEFEPLR